jgi:hypothetical protein
MWPEENGASKLIFNKKLAEWGAYTYDQKEDVARVDLKKETVPTPADQFTIKLEKGEKGSGLGTMKFVWADTCYSVPFTVKK